MKSNDMKKKQKNAVKGQTSPVAGNTPAIPGKDTSFRVARRLHDRNKVASVTQVTTSAPVQPNKLTADERLALLQSLLTDDPAEIADQIATLAVLTHTLPSNEDTPSDKQ